MVSPAELQMFRFKVGDDPGCECISASTKRQGAEYHTISREFDRREFEADPVVSQAQSRAAFWKHGTAESKIAALKSAGISVAESPATIGETMAKVLGVAS